MQPAGGVGDAPLQLRIAVVVEVAPLRIELERREPLVVQLDQGREQRLRRGGGDDVGLGEHQDVRQIGVADALVERAGVGELAAEGGLDQQLGRPALQAPAGVEIARLALPFRSRHATYSRAARPATRPCTSESVIPFPISRLRPCSPPTISPARNNPGTGVSHRAFTRKPPR